LSSRNLLAKTYRVWRLFRGVEKLRVIKITTLQLLPFVGGAVLIDIVSYIFEKKKKKNENRVYRLLFNLDRKFKR
jgi:hypothetical protein